VIETWLHIVVRQIMLYSLPVLISLSVAGMVEAMRLSHERRPANPFFPLAWHGAWLPLLASIFFNRAVIIALPRPVHHGLRPALMRFTATLLLGIAGFGLYAWALAHQPAAGLPPLHQWWAKVLMFFNLCMMAMHLLPLPGMLAGEWWLRTKAGTQVKAYLSQMHVVWFCALLAASPLLDITIGKFVVFPVYETMANLAAQWS